MRNPTPEPDFYTFPSDRIVVMVPEGVRPALDRLAARYGLNRSDIMRDAIAEILNGQGMSFPESLDLVRPNLGKLEPEVVEEDGEDE